MIRPVSSVVSAAVNPEPVVAGVASRASAVGSVAVSSAAGWTTSTGAVDTAALHRRGGVLGGGSSVGSTAGAVDDDAG